MSGAGDAQAEKAKAQELRNLVAEFDRLGIPPDHPLLIAGLKAFEEQVAERFAADRARLAANQAVKH